MMLLQQQQHQRELLDCSPLASNRLEMGSQLAPSLSYDEATSTSAVDQPMPSFNPVDMGHATVASTNDGGSTGEGDLCTEELVRGTVKPCC